jgi:hypothetical protein
MAAQVLKALVGDVVIEARKIEGQASPQMVARFTINAVAAMAVLERGRPITGLRCRLDKSVNGTGTRTMSLCRGRIPILVVKRVVPEFQRASRCSNKLVKLHFR